jgi:membrane protein YdbS with pleckstrin-like domain
MMESIPEDSAVSVINRVRLVITAFILILLTVVTLGVLWNSSHQPPAMRTPGLAVLGLAGLAGVFALARLWRHEAPPRASRGREVRSSH